MKKKSDYDSVEDILVSLEYDVWREEGSISAERRLAGVIYRVFYGPEGDLKLEKVRNKPEEVREAMLADHNGQFVRQEEIRESFFGNCEPGELLQLIKAWES